ncbi:MAG: transglutaminase-like domain-containing protein [Candidatus Binatia bacterium]
MMNRRAFLKQGLMVSAGVVLAGMPRFARGASANQAPWRTFEVTTRLAVTDVIGAVQAWVPVPLTSNTEYCQREPDRWTGNFTSAQVMQHDPYGTGMVFAQWAAGENAPVLEVTSRFRTRDRQVELNRKPNLRMREDQAVLAYFRQPSKLIRTDGVVAATAKGIVEKSQSEVGKARAIYEWIVDHTFRDPKVKGCGTGDIAAMLETRSLGGKCADLNALFVGLARAAGLPARDVYGIRCAASQEFKSLGRADDITSAQHCRAEVYLTGYGWVPVDPADVRKVVLEENAPGVPLPLDDPKVQKARAKLFGAWEMNWLPYNYAHDVRLPHATGPELGFFMYPQAETAKGRKDSLDPKQFTYTITAKEI